MARIKKDKEKTKMSLEGQKSQLINGNLNCLKQNQTSC